MTSILNPVTEARLLTLIYKVRFLGLYIIFGFISITLELAILNYLIEVGFKNNFSILISTFIGVLFAYFANVNFNFKIPKSRRNRALLYFISISLLSAFMQWNFGRLTFFENFNYEIQRLVISGSLFIIGYILHRKYSFRDYKKVGVAVYANGVENLKKIHDRIGQHCDFIHVDVVDNTMSKEAEEIKAYKIETMKAYWPDSQIQTHIMSKKPSIWIDQVILHSDVVYVHAESDEDVSIILDEIKNQGKYPGLALTLSTNLKSVIKLLKKSSHVLLLTIPKPGFSGQKFSMDAIERIKEINDLSFRDDFSLCIDGGVNENIVSLLDAENIVSGSSVLKNRNPKKQIMLLQTIGRYGA
ncbi:GtrA family protein [Candidatus Marinimicrobia bacterium]|nr:GtrA family protein [Candidatus Neomarinimicrobiota bacterium]